MGTTTTTYADAVRRALDDLPAARYLELVDGLDEHLAEVRAEADGSLADVLGPPETYAAELRASAGLPPRSGPTTGTPLPPPVAPPAPARERRPIDRGLLARVGLAVAGGLIVLWALGVQELPTMKLALIVLGLLGAMWFAGRLLGAATLADRTSRRVKVAIAIGGLLAAAAFGSAASERRIYTPIYEQSPVTFAPIGGPQVLLPDFRGFGRAEAAQQARELGLDVAEGPYEEMQRVVVDQDPPPGTLVLRGSTVRFAVEGGPAVPRFPTTTSAVTLPTVPSITAAPATTTLPAPTTAAAAATTTLPPPTTSVAAAPSTAATSATTTAG